MERVTQKGESRLSPRERQVVLLSTFSNKEIGGVLGISEQTVKNYLTAAFDVLGAKSRTHAIGRAIRLGEIRLDEVPLPGNVEKIEAIKGLVPLADPIQGLMILSLDINLNF